jgi:ribosomal protein S18 acetylase RimI-like enzyme
LRPAAAGDVEAIAAIWYAGWRDGHLGHVPEALIAHRTPEQFGARVPGRLSATTVAAADDVVLGFVTVLDDEVEQLYVDASARGTGVADLLLRHGETEIARQYTVAWLAVVGGNARARRFYERNGWRDAGPLAYAAQVDGGRIDVPTRRYEKPVRPR